MLRKTTLKRPAAHVFIADPGDRQVCVAPECGLPERNDVHTVPGVTDAQAAQEARKLGETPNREDHDGSQ